MKKILFFMMTCLGLSLQSYAQSTDISTYENVIYLKNAIGISGSQVVLSLQMNNEVEARGFQCDVYLPEGITFATDGEGNPLASLSTARTTAAKTNFFSSAIQDDGCLRILCNSTTGYSFEDNEGEVALIPVNIDAAKAGGTYTMYVKNTKISDPQAQDHNVDEAINSTVTVKASYDAGCAVQILPFAFTEDVDGLEFVVTTPAALTNITFDIEFPEVIGQNQLYTVSKALGNTTATTSITDDEAGNVNVSIARKTTKTIADGATIAKLEIGFDGEVLTSGIEQINIKNIQFTDASGNIYFVAPYSADIFVGENPKAAITDKTVAFHGDFSGEDEIALLNAALPAEGFDVVDLAAVTAVSAETAIAPANANVLYLNPKGITLANDNSIVNGTCAQFTLTDGHNYNAPFAFTATKAAYTRNFKNHNWQALYLPYEVAVSAISGNFEVAEMTAVSTGDAVVIEKLTSGTLAANYPYFIRLKADKETKEYTLEATNQDIAITATNPQTYGDFTLTGIYEAMNGTQMQTNNAFGLSGGKFCKAQNAAVLNAFRFYLTGASSDVKIVVDGETGIEGIHNAEFIIHNDETSEIYNLAGQKMQKAQKGVNIVNGKKVLF